jgi:glycosyltransferase involved in cell wall biosynthesis
VKRILLYSPDVIGHPRVYCRVIADALAGSDCAIVVAIGFTDQVGLAQSPDLAPLATRAGVHLVETRAWSKRGETNLAAEELIALQRHFAIDVTLFIEADKSADEFKRIAAGAAPRLHGRNLGIFANTAEWYPGEDSFTGARRRLLAPTLRTTLGNVKRRLLERDKSARHFYERTLLAARVLDELLVKDERLSDWRGPPVYWMPEISRPAAAPETPEEAAEFDRRKAELDAFLAVNRGREPVLYFGDAAYYKGYDLFLEFVAKLPSTCAIHPGRSYDPRQQGYFRCDVAALRERLKAEGRLYETNDYVHTQRLKELYFATPRVYLTTHRLALSSSTVIQALELGKPVLVPDRGLLGHRVRSNGLGAVYRYEDIDDLARRAQAMWAGDLSGSAAAAKRFWQRFSDTAIRAFFRARLGVDETHGERAA